MEGSGGAREGPAVKQEDASVSGQPRFWRSPRFIRWASYALLGALVIDIFVTPPLVTTHALSRWVLAATTSATLVVAIVALGGHVAARRLVAGVAATALVSHWVHQALGAAGTEMLGAATMGVATAVFAGMLLRDVFSKGKLPDRLLAVLLAYLLIGSTWAEAYHLLDLVYPGALSLPGGEHPVSEYIYFSFATITSLGSGDVLPLHPFARSMATLEALTGQLYAVLIISRFVGEQAVAKAKAGDD